MGCFPIEAAGTDFDRGALAAIAVRRESRSHIRADLDNYELKCVSQNSVLQLARSGVFLTVISED